MHFSRMKMLAGMEFLKLPARINIVFSLVVVVVVVMQVWLVVRLEKETAEVYAEEKFAGEKFPAERYSIDPHSDKSNSTKPYPAEPNVAESNSSERYSEKPRSAEPYSAESSSTESSVFDYANRYINNIAITFIPILFLVNAGREFEQGIVHRSLISGISRLEYYISRIIQLLIFSVFAFLLAIVFTLITAAIYKLPVVWNFEKLSLYFIVSFCLGIFAFVMVLLLKKTFYSLATFVCYVMAENIFSMNMAAKKLDVLLPFTAAGRMLKEGTYRFEDIVVLGISTGVLLVLGYFRFLKSDLR